MSHRRPKKVSTGIFSEASDWLLRADLGGSFTVPFLLAPTTLVPDIVIYSMEKKRVVIIELTCCCEQNFSSWHAEKARKYSLELIPNMRENGWKVSLFPIEVGARGYCSTSVKSCLVALGFSNRKTKEALQRIGRVALETSFHIWLCRNTTEWSFDEKQPWDSFSNPVDITKPSLPEPYGNCSQCR